jgi:hypothetical protein
VTVMTESLRRSLMRLGGVCRSASAAAALVPSVVRRALHPATRVGSVEPRIACIASQERFGHSRPRRQFALSYGRVPVVPPRCARCEVCAAARPHPPTRLGSSRIALIPRVFHSGLARHRIVDHQVDEATHVNLLNSGARVSQRVR